MPSTNDPVFGGIGSGGSLTPLVAPTNTGPTRSTVGAITAAGCTVTVQQQAILTGIMSLLAGATANVVVIEQ